MIEKYQNKQKYSECQLVSIWNAARYYGMEDKVPKLGTIEYEQACEDFHCKNGSCLRPGKELNRLGLKMIKGKWDYSWIANNLPVELSISPPNRRVHSILVVGALFNTLEIANFGEGEGKQSRDYKVLEKMQIHNPFFSPMAIKKVSKFMIFLKNLGLNK